MADFNLEETIKNAALEQKARTSQRQENLERYQVRLTDDQYDFVSTLFKDIADPVEAENMSYRVANALKYSEIYGMTPDEAYLNLEALNRANFGEDYKQPKSAFIATCDAFQQGLLQLERNKICNQIWEAERNGYEDFSALKNYLAEINSQIASLEDTQSRTWWQNCAKWGAQSAPFTAGAIASSAVGALLGGGVGAAVLGTTYSWDAMKGEIYQQLRDDGASVETAGAVANVSALLQGIVEETLGTVAGAAGKLVGKGASKTVSKSFIDNLTKGAYKNLYYAGGFKRIASLIGKTVLEYLGEAVEEGSEEVLQEIIDTFGRSIAYAIDEYGKDPNLSEEEKAQLEALNEELSLPATGKRLLQSFAGGFGGALVLGIPNAGFSARANIKDFSEVKKAASTIDSKEAFIAGTAKSPIFEGMDAKTKAETQENIYDKFSAIREKNAEERRQAEIDRAETIETSDLAEETQTDEEGKVVVKEAYRTDTGRLNTEDRLIEENDDGTSSHEFAIKGKDEELYGRIIYNVDGDNVIISDYFLTPGRENLRTEAYMDFAEKFAGKNIEWETRGENAAKVKQALIDLNATGSKNGLNYYTDKNEANNQRARLSLADEMRKARPNATNEEIIGNIAAMESSLALSLPDKTLGDWYFNTAKGKVFTTEMTARQYQQAVNHFLEQNYSREEAEYKARNEVGGFFDLSQVEKAGRGFIYVSKNSDARTFMHEWMHFMRTQFTPEQNAEIGRLIGVKDSSKWSREDEERLVDYYMRYAAEGNTQKKELEPLFKKLNNALVRFYKVIVNAVEMSPEIRDFFDSLFKDPASALSQAERALNQLDRASNISKALVEDRTSNNGRIVQDTNAAMSERVEASMDDAGEIFTDLVFGETSQLDDWKLEYADKRLHEILDKKEADRVYKNLLRTNGTGYARELYKALKARSEILEALKTHVIDSKADLDPSDPDYCSSYLTSYKWEQIPVMKADGTPKLNKDGKQVYRQGKLLSYQPSPLGKLIMAKGEAGLWEYAKKTSFIGNAAKPVYALNGSLFNCNPSTDCAKYCYATTGNYMYPAAVVKAELINMLIEKDTKAAAEIIANEYKASPDYDVGQALRIFDKGDLSEKWVELIMELNARQVSIQIFSKRPDLLSKIDLDVNVGMLSLDVSNMTLADRYPNLPIAFVYNGTEEALNFIMSHKTTFEKNGGVILPVQGTKVVTEESVKALVSTAGKWVNNYLCPIDAGYKELGEIKNKGVKYRNKWHCIFCDRDGGSGCFYKKGVYQRKIFEKNMFDLTPKDMVKYAKELSKEYTKNHAENVRGIKRLLESLLAVCNEELGRYERESKGEGYEHFGQPAETRLRRPAGTDRTFGRLILQNGDFKTVEQKDNPNLVFQILPENYAKFLGKENMLAQAKEMFADGKDLREIKKSTGWEQDLQGNWVYETADNKDLVTNYENIGFKLASNLKSLRSQTNSNAEAKLLEKTTDIGRQVLSEFNTDYTKLSSIVDSELLKKSAKLSNINLVWVDDTRPFRVVQTPDTFFLNIRNIEDSETLRRSILGELQYWYETGHGYSRADSNEQLRLLKELVGKVEAGDLEGFHTDFDSTDPDMYYHMINQEATRRRADMNSAQRRATTLQDTYAEIEKDWNKNTTSEQLYFQIIGEEGAQALDDAEEKTVRMDNLKVAIDMTSAGKDAKTIRLATGWEKGVDGKWRYEIDDLLNRFDLINKVIDFEKKNPKFQELYEKLLRSYEGGPELTEAEWQEYDLLGDEENQLYNKKNVQLKDVMDAPELYIAYPQLKNMEIRFVDDPLNTVKARYVSGRELWSDAVVKYIQVNNIPNSINEKEYESILLHELQHAIQNIEGFGPGGSVNFFKEKREKYESLVESIEMEMEIIDKTIPEEDKIDFFSSHFESPEDYEQKEKEFYSKYDNGLEYLRLQNILYKIQAENRDVRFKSDFDNYQSLAGEVESRNVQARMNLTPEERLYTLLRETEDVEREDQIVLSDGSESSNILFQTVYHGSAADFDRFDTENYGFSGEGSMSFGYGTYVTNSEEIARDYAKRQVEKKSLKNFAEAMLEHIESGLRTFEEEKQFAIERYSKYIKTGDSRSITHDMPRLEFAQSLTSLDDLKKAVEPTGKRHLYTTTIPDDGYIKWDDTISRKTIDKVKEGLFNKLAYEPNSDGEYEYKGVEKQLKKELDGVFDSEYTGRSLYGTVSSYLGGDKEASQFLSSIGYVGIDYPAGTNFGNGNGARNFVIFNDLDAQIVDNLLFQYMQEELDAQTLEEAAGFNTWQEWYEYAKVMDTDGVLTGAWDDVKEQKWFEAVWTYAKSIYEGTEEFVEPTTEPADNRTQEQLDKDFVGMLQEEGALQEFATQIRKYVSMEESLTNPMDEAEAAEFDRIVREKSYINRKLADPTWNSEELSPTQTKKLLTAIKDNPREYRAIYGEVYDDDTYKVPEDMRNTVEAPADTAEEQLLQLDRMTPTQRAKAVQNLEDDRIRQQVKDGTLKMDGTIDRAIEVLSGDIDDLNKKITELQQEYDNALAEIKNEQKADLVREYAELQEQVEKLERIAPRRIDGTIKNAVEAGKEAQSNVSSGTNSGKIAEINKRMEYLHQILEGEKAATKAIEAAKAKGHYKTLYNKKLEDRRTEQDIRRARNAIVKGITRRVNFATVDYETGRRIIAVQNLLNDWLADGVNKWIGTESPYLREVYSAYVTDEKARAEIQQKLNGRKRKYTAIAALNLLEGARNGNGKQFDEWTNTERKTVLKGLGNTDWYEKLSLANKAKERQEQLPNQLNKNGKVTDETRKLAESILNPEIMARIEYQPMAEWNINQMEELGKLIDDAYVEGKKLLAGRQQLRRDEIEAIREQIKKTIRDTGIAINPEDPEDVKKKKQEKINRILGMRNAAKGTSAAAKEKNSFRDKFMALDRGTGNVRRFARVMDNYSENVFTTTLCFREYAAYNEEQKRIKERTARIENYLKEHNIDMDMLQERYDFPALMNGKDKSFSIDELLYIYVADMDEKSRDAVMYGNFGTAEEQEIAAKMDIDGLTGYKAQAYQRYLIVLNKAQELVNGNKDLLGLVNIIEKDYAEQYDRLNEASINLFNMPVNRVSAYVPLYRLEASGEALEQQVARDLMADTTGAPAQYVNRGMTKNRITISPLHQKPVQLGLMKTWADSMAKTEHFVAYGGLVRDLNAIYTGSAAAGTREVIASRYGDDANAYIKDYINELANPNKHQIKTTADKLAHLLRGKTAPAYLSWKASGVIKQLCTSPWPFMAYITPAEYLVAMGKFIAHPSRMSDLVKSKSVFMETRTIDPIIDLIKEAEDKADNKTKALFAQINSMGMQGLEWADWVSVAPGWLAMYDRTIAELNKQNNGKSELDDDYIDPLKIEEMAIAKADDTVRLTQPSGRKADLAPLFKNSSEVANLVLQFQTALNCIYQQIRFDIPYQIHNKQHWQIVGSIIGYTMAGILVNAVVGGLGDDDDDTADKVKRGVYYATTQFTDAVPMVGSQLTGLTEKLLTGKGQYFSTNLFPVLESLKNTVVDVSNENWTKACEDFAQGVGFTLGMPVSGSKEIKALLGIDEMGDKIELHPEALWGRRE